MVSTKCHHSNKFGTACVPDAVYQVSCSLDSWFQRRRFLKVFTIYEPGSHLGHVTREYLNKFSSKYPMEAQYEIWLFEEKMLQRKLKKKSGSHPFASENNTFCFISLVKYITMKYAYYFIYILLYFTNLYIINCFPSHLARINSV